MRSPNCCSGIAMGKLLPSSQIPRLVLQTDCVPKGNPNSMVKVYQNLARRVIPRRKLARSQLENRHEMFDIREIGPSAPTNGVASPEGLMPAIQSNPNV